MADIFLSYHREDRDRASRIADAPVAAKFSVWWDNSLEPGDRWSEVIEKNISEAKAVIVLWSPSSVKSEWVRAEASYGSSTNKLIPIVIEATSIPLAFMLVQAADLTGWDGNTSAPNWRRILQWLSDLVGKPRHEEREQASEPPQTTSRHDADANLQDLVLPEPGTGAIQPADTPGQSVTWDIDRPYNVKKGLRRRSIFIAHASADKRRLSSFIEIIYNCGFNLWIDRPQEIDLPPQIESHLAGRRIKFGHDWQEGIRRAIRKADYVLAFWYRDSIDARRERFQYEVYQGMVQGKLRQCYIDKMTLVEIGMPYTFEQIADLSQFIPGKYHPNLEYLLNDMS